MYMAATFLADLLICLDLDLGRIRKLLWRQQSFPKETEPACAFIRVS